MSIIRQTTLQLLAEEFSNSRKIDDCFWSLRHSLGHYQMLQVLILLDPHLENICKEIDDVVIQKLDLCQTLDIDVTSYANRFFLRLVNLVPTNH